MKRSNKVIQGRFPGSRSVFASQACWVMGLVYSQIERWMMCQVLANSQRLSGVVDSVNAENWLYQYVSGVVLQVWGFEGVDA